MAGIAEIVARAPGAMFAVDERMRIVAWNRAAAGLLGVAEPRVLGRRCFDTIHAVDTDTGRPCYESCPLMTSSARHGWVHSKVLEAVGTDQRATQLDCMLLRYVLPGSERGTLSFVTPLGTADAAEYVRALAATEALYPLLSGATDPLRGLRELVRTLLQTTRAHVAELSLLHPQTGQPFKVIRQAVDEASEARFERWPRQELRELAASAGEALVAILPEEAEADHRPPTAEDTATTDGATGRRGEASAGTERPLCWRLAVPIVADERLLGVLVVMSQRAISAMGFAARVLFPVAAQLAVFLRWALVAEAEPRRGAVSEATAGAGTGVAVSPRLRFYCFGRFRVELDGREVPSGRFKRQKALALLKLLVAHRGRPFRREALIEALWPEANPDLGANNLRVVLHDLRHGLEPALGRGQASTFILGRGDLLYLDPSERCWVDAEQLTRLARELEARRAAGQVEAALAAGREAVALYTADYLEDEPYEDWCIAERERLREVYLDLLQKMAALYAERGELEAAIDACRRALAADPLREKIHRQLMALLAQAGHRDLALRQYETCRRLLREELDVEPDEETRRLYAALTSPSPSAASRQRQASGRERGADG